MIRTPRVGSARARILGVVLAVTCVGLIVMGGITFAVQHDRVLTDTDAQLAAFADVAGSATATGDPVRDAVADATPDPGEGYVALRGGTVVDAAPAPGIDLAADVGFTAAVAGRADDAVAPRTAAGATGALRYIAVPIGDTVLVHAVSLDARLTLVHLGIATYAVAGIALLLAIGVVGWFVAGRLLSPIRHLRDTADSITIADLGARIPAEGNDEIADLGRTVNSMLDRLEGSVDVQRQLLDDVRHELKTPITIVRGHLEVMDAADPSDVDNIREIGIAELDRMNRLVDDIDLLATVERGALSMGVIDVEALTTRVGELVAVIPGHEWSVETRGRGRVAGDYERILQAWLQLADNAAKYTPADTPVEIGSAIDEHGAQLWVRDHGPGIPHAARHRIFRRFDRAHGKRSVGGSGLGLAIVDAIAKSHGGHCAVVDTPGGGATFVMRIPLGSGASFAEMPAPVRAGDVVLQRETSG